MAQTLLALLSLMVALMFTNTVVERRIDFNRSAIRMEMEEMAASASLRVIETVRNQPYDSNIENKKSTYFDEAKGTLKPSYTISNLTAEMEAQDSFPQGKHCQQFGGLDACEDVNDFHMMAPIQIAYAITPTDSIYFRVSMEVLYADKNGIQTPGGTRSQYKLLVASVQDVWADGRTGVYLPAPVNLGRLITINL